MQEITKPKGLAKIRRKIKNMLRQIGFLPYSRIYRRAIPTEGIKYIGNDEYGTISVDARKNDQAFFEYPDMIVANQSIGKHFIQGAKKIVNIGSGVGTFEHCNAAGHSDALFVASEFDSSSIAWCKRNRSMPNVVFTWDDMESLGQTYGKFDLAVSIDVIEHIKDYGRFLNEFVQLANCAVIATPNRDRWHRMTDLQSPPYQCHTHEFNAGELYFLLKAYYKNVDLYSFPDPLEHEMIPVGIYSSFEKLVAHCSNP